MSRVIAILFYGNFFLGLCAVALCLETSLQLEIPLNTAVFYVLILFAVTAYYSTIYYRSSLLVSSNSRIVWYQQHRKYITLFLIFLWVVVLASLAYLINLRGAYLMQLNYNNLLLLVAFPLLVLLYNFGLFPFKSLKNLRRIGWLKPFVLGCAWSGIVTICPTILKGNALGSGHFVFTQKVLLLWLQNFFITSIIAVAFDVKDYDTDQRFRLNTYPVILGIHKAVSFVIVPQILLAFAVMTFFHLHFAGQSLPYLVKLLPYVFLFFIATRLYRKNNLMFYLVLVDGVMFVKALCGIASVLLFK